MAEPTRNAYEDNPEVAHEKSDVATGAILRFGLALGAILLAALLVLFALFTYFNSREMRFGRGPARGPTAEQLPPEPRLEISPRANLAELRAAEEEILGSYNWAGKEKNMVRIPIERAMELIAERGLPARKQPKEDQR